MCEDEIKKIYQAIDQLAYDQPKADIDGPNPDVEAYYRICKRKLYLFFNLSSHVGRLGIQLTRT